jgi:hypothetical protein
MRTHHDRLRRYGFALLSLALAAAVMAIPEIRYGAGTPILVYFFAVLLSAWYGGLGPGLLTTAVIVVMTSHTSFPFWRVVRLGLGIACGVDQRPGRRSSTPRRGPSGMSSGFVP